VKKPLSLAGLLLIPSLAAAQPWSAGLNDAVLRSTEKTGDLHFQKVNLASNDRDMIALVKKTAPAVVQILVKGKPEPVAEEPEDEDGPATPEEKKKLEEFFGDLLKQYKGQGGGAPEERKQADPAPSVPAPGGSKKPDMRTPADTGSGVIISYGGHKLIVTNAHVVEIAGSKATVDLTFDDGSKGKGVVIGYNEKYDLAFIEPNGICPTCRAMPIGNSGSLQRGQAVVAIGSPYSLDRSVTSGIISFIGRDTGNSVVPDYIQTDAAVNPGNSGGALVDRHGRLVGINTAIYSRNGGFVGIAFATPSSYIPHLLQRFLRTGTISPSVMGVVVGQMPQKGADGKYLTNGDGGSVLGPLSVAQDPKPESPAAKAGFQQGDEIVSVDGKPVKTAAEYVRVVVDKVPGEKVVVVVRRGDQTLTLSSDVALLHD